MLGLGEGPRKCCMPWFPIHWLVLVRMLLHVYHRRLIQRGACVVRA